MALKHTPRYEDAMAATLCLMTLNPLLRKALITILFQLSNTRMEEDIDHHIWIHHICIRSTWCILSYCCIHNFAEALIHFKKYLQTIYPNKTRSDWNQNTGPRRIVKDRGGSVWTSCLKQKRKHRHDRRNSQAMYRTSGSRNR